MINTLTTAPKPPKTSTLNPTKDFFSPPAQDVLEEMIKSEIYDESDEAEEILSRRKREAHPHRQDVSIYLNLFEHKMRGLRLSPPEVQAVFAFLAVNLEVSMRQTLQGHAVVLFRRAHS